MDEKAVSEDISIIDELAQYLRTHQLQDDGEENVAGEEVSKISREVGQLYEKLRFAIDNKEEQFFRRHAIRRALRRKSVFMTDPERMFDTLMLDLVRGGYLEGTQVSAVRRTRALAAIRSFLKLSQLLRDRYELAPVLRFRKFLLDIVAGALEDALYDTTKEEGIAMVMARVGERVVRGEALEALSPTERRTLFYVASWRSLFSGDASLLRYKLWLLHVPHWDQEEAGTLEIIASELLITIRGIERTIERPLGRRILPKLHDTGIACTLLYDAVCEYGAGINTVLQNTELCSSRVRTYIETRYRDDLIRARRRSVRAIIYIFVTKSVLAVGVEAAYVIFLKHTLNFFAITLNIVTHPVLLFLLVGGLNKPSQKNTERAVEMVRKIVSGTPLPLVVLPKERQGILTDIALGVYVAMFCASMYGLVLLLMWLSFNLADIVLFILFLLLVLYFGFRIRMGAYRMRFTDTKESFIRGGVELLLLPLVSLGRYMSIKFENINIAAIVLDYIIEAPLRLVLRFFDAFSSYVSEKREEIYSP